MSNGQQLCTVMSIIAGLAAGGEDPIEKPQGVLLPEDGFDWYIDLSIKLDEVAKIPRYRFNGMQLVLDSFNVLQSAFQDIREMVSETGVNLSAEETEEKVIADLVAFFDACIADATQSKTVN